MYEIRSSAAKGLGVFATRQILRGTRIFSEGPLLYITPAQSACDIYNTASSLSLADRKRLLALSHHVTRELAFRRGCQALWWTLKSVVSPPFGRPRFTSLREYVKILGIFRSNCFDINTTDMQQAVFGDISRINHSCIPNSQGNYHEAAKRFNVHATRDIAVGEELSINYLQEHGALRSARQEKLAGYGFTCNCLSCDVSTERGKAGEDKRKTLHSMLEEFARSAAQGGKPDIGRELKVVNAFIKLMEDEGIAGRELSSLYFEAARLNKTLGKNLEALNCAEKGLILGRHCLGEDHELYREDLSALEDYRRGI